MARELCRFIKQHHLLLMMCLTALEGGSGAICTASGMSSLYSTFTTLCSAGDHIVSSEQIYGSTATLLRHTLPRFDINTDFVPINDEKALRTAIKPNTKLVFCESISNPGMEVSDLPQIAKIANEMGVPVVVDAELLLTVETLIGGMAGFLK